MSLGPTPTLPQILAEVDETLPHTFPSTKTRWLAGSQSLVFPTSFANKTRIIEVDQQALTSPGSTVLFSGLDCGSTITGRMLIAVMAVAGTSGGAINIPAQPQVNGVGATADASWYTNTSGHSIAVCIATLNDTTTLGTNGSAQLQTSGATISHAHCIFLAAYDTEQLNPHDRETVGSVSNVSTRSDLINVPAKGQVISAEMHYNNNPATVTGLTKRFGVNVGPGHLTVAFDTLMGLETNRNISYSWTGAAVSGMSTHSRAN